MCIRDRDILSASDNDDTIAWYENDGAANPSWTAADIDTSADSARDVLASDIDGDGDIDLVSASYNDDTIAWYESDGAANPSWTKKVITTSVDGAMEVKVGDFDEDGDIDIFIEYGQDMVQYNGYTLGTGPDLLYPVIIILEPFFITLIIFFSTLLLAIQAKLSLDMSNLILFLPDFANIVFCTLYSYPDVMLTSSVIFSAGLKLMNSLASRTLFFGDCNTGLD